MLGGINEGWDCVCVKHWHAVLAVFRWLSIDDLPKEQNLDGVRHIYRSDRIIHNNPDSQLSHTEVPAISAVT